MMMLRGLTSRWTQSWPPMCVEAGAHLAGEQDELLPRAGRTARTRVDRRGPSRCSSRSAAPARRAGRRRRARGPGAERVSAAASPAIAWRARGSPTRCGRRTLATSGARAVLPDHVGLVPLPAAEQLQDPPAGRQLVLRPEPQAVRLAGCSGPPGGPGSRSGCPPRPGRGGRKRAWRVPCGPASRPEIGRWLGEDESSLMCARRHRTAFAPTAADPLTPPSGAPRGRGRARPAGRRRR